MKKLLLLCPLIAAAMLQIFANDNEAIAAATRNYVTTNSGMTKFVVVVEQVADDFARARVVPEDPKAADPAWVFLKKKDGKWTGLIIGTGLTTEDYQQLGIPNALRVP